MASIDELVNQLNKKNSTNPSPSPTQTSESLQAHGEPLKEKQRIKVPSLPSRPDVSPNTGHRTSIRTMRDDIANIQKGQALAGREMVSHVPIADVKEKTQQDAKKELLKEVSKLKMSSDKIQEASKLTKDNVKMKRMGSLSYMSIIVVLLGLLGYGIFLVFSNSGGDTPPLPSPTVSSTPTPTPSPVVSLSDIFEEPIAELDVDTSDLVNSFKESSNAFIFSEDEFVVVKASASVSLLDLIVSSQDISDVLGDDALTLLYNQSLAFDTSGEILSVRENRIVFVNEIINTGSLFDTLRLWEADMPNDFKEIFDLDLARQSDTVFTGTAYNTVPVRFINFPYPDRSVDYAVVSAANGKNYLVVSNSRESIFATIDILVGF
jgi:hypothetical protein